MNLIFRCATSAWSGTLADQSDLVVEADVVAVVERQHEVLEEFRVRVFTLDPWTLLKGDATAPIELVLVGGTHPDGSKGGVAGAPKLEVGDHVLVFLRARDLGKSVALREAGGVRLASFAGVLHRALDDQGREVALDAWNRPLSLAALEGVPAPAAPEAEVADGADEPTPEEAVRVEPVAADWTEVVDTVAAQIAAAPQDARPAVDLGVLQ